MGDTNDGGVGTPGSDSSGTDNSGFLSGLSSTFNQLAGTVNAATGLYTAAVSPFVHQNGVGSLQTQPTILVQQQAPKAQLPATAASSTGISKTALYIGAGAIVLVLVLVLVMKK